MGATRPGGIAYDVSIMTQTLEHAELTAAGFKLVWVVSPELRMVDIYRADGSVSRLHENDEITGESALPSFRCKVADFFR